MRIEFLLRCILPCVHASVCPLSLCMFLNIAVMLVLSMRQLNYIQSIPLHCECIFFLLSAHSILGDVSRSELLFFKQSLPSPVLPPATAATAAAAAAVVASQARQARHAKATAAAAAISTTADLSRSINAVSGNNYGDESSMRSDDFVGRVLTSLLVEAAQANHLGLDSRKGGAEVVVGDVENGPDSAAVFTANVDGSRSRMDSASLNRYAFVPSEMVPSSVSAATATTTTTLLGDVLTKALPGLLGQAQSLRCR